uniref:(S)-ureidoglycine aminohydrolase cupin domain-containing protein n=1 Tax=Oryza meridionalis TaxID=40149 RepID=A0A0E0DET2_9ORYZ
MASPTMVGVATSAHLHTTTTGRLSCACAPPTRGTRRRRLAVAVRVRVRASASEAMATEKLGVRVERNPPESRLSELGVREWPKWGCEKSKFPWTYSAKETCYLLQGKVKVYPDGAGEDFVEIAAGDLVVFPKGMNCTWDVAEAVDKHYKFE